MSAWPHPPLLTRSQVAAIRAETLEEARRAIADMQNWRDTISGDALLRTDLILDEVGRERARQIVKGYDAAHDDQHVHSEISYEAAQAILPRGATRWIKATTRREKLIRGIALAVAEVERLDRSVAK